MAGGKAEVLPRSVNPLVNARAPPDSPGALTVSLYPSLQQKRKQRAAPSGAQWDSTRQSCGRCCVAFRTFLLYGRMSAKRTAVQILHPLLGPRRMAQAVGLESSASSN